MSSSVGVKRESVEAHGEECERCPLTEGMARRTFVRDVGVAIAGLFAAIGVTASEAHAFPVRLVSAVASDGDDRSYPIPSFDGATIDKKESVIIARWQGMVYAFSLACPHQNTALKWEQDNARFQCPKHHSKYRPDGSFIEGRATRGMDRLAVRRDGENVVVDLERMYRQDEDGAEWKAAFIQL